MVIITNRTHRRARLVAACQAAIARGDKERAEALDRAINRIDRKPAP